MSPNGEGSTEAGTGPGARARATRAVAGLPVAIGLLAGALGGDSAVRPGGPRAGIAAAVDTVAPLSVDVGDQQFQVYFGNLHSHTDLSDGSANPQQAYTHARDVAGLDFLAVTEHNHASAGRIQHRQDLYSDSLVSVAEQLTDPGSFVALFGQEYSSISSGNHANVLDVADVIHSSEVPNGNWRALLENWLPNHLDSSGRPPLLLLNHPATSGSPNTLEYGVDEFTPAAWRAALDEHAQLINIVNGPSHQANRPPGRPSESEFRRYLNLGFHLAPTADQDNHLENWGSAAATRTGVIATELTKEAILGALRARRVYATEDRNLRLIGLVDRHLMGSRVTAGLPAPGDQLDVRLTIQDDDEPLASYRIDVFADVPGDHQAEVVQSVSATGNGTVTIPGIPFEGAGQYVFLRVSQLHDEDLADDRAWLAPVWFEGAAPPDPPSGSSAVALTVDLVSEEVRVVNLGVQPLDLGGWRLLSVRGNQEFVFPTVLLEPQDAVTIVAGPDQTATPPGVLLWSTQRVWNNDGDAAELYDEEGHLVAEEPE